MRKRCDVVALVSCCVVGIIITGCGGGSAGVTAPWRFTNLAGVFETITLNQSGNALSGSTDAGGTVSGTISDDKSVSVTVTYPDTVVNMDLAWDGANQMTGTATDLENNSTQVQLDKQDTGDGGVQESPSLEGTLTGSYSGSCDSSGPVSGTFEMNIDAAGNVTGTYTGTSSGTIAGTVTGLGSFSSMGSGSGTDGVSWSGVIQRVDANSIRGSGTWSGDDWFGGQCTGRWSSYNN